jgi:putative phosphoribosyl transferase
VAASDIAANAYGANPLPTLGFHYFHGLRELPDHRAQQGRRVDVMKIFRDRTDAGRQLADSLRGLAGKNDVVVLGLPRGGVPVAREVAAALGAPLDVCIVRKLGAPFNPELAVGAIAFGGVTVYNDSLLAELGLDEADIDGIRQREHAELLRRERAYRGARPPLELAGKTVILVDDGIATGATMHAAVMATRKLEPKSIIVAVPTSAVDSVARLEEVADGVIALATPEPYYGVGVWYEEFPQVADADVLRCLEAPGPSCDGGQDRDDARRALM